MKRPFRPRLLAAPIAAALLAACGGGGSDTPAAGWQTDAAGSVTLRFAAYNGASPIDCASSLKLGTRASAVKMADFRFYVSAVRLVREDGSKVALRLKGNDDFNYSDGTDSVTLIDLEQRGTGACVDGSPAVNAVVEGTVPPGRYTGAELTLGVPFALNHLNAADAATPRVLQSAVHPGMSWNWRGGRKFTNIQFDQDAAADPTPWASAAAAKQGRVLLHVGSTGCLGDPANGTPITGCKAPNRVPVALAGFDPSRQLIAVDAGALFGYDITAAGEGGCMSGATHAACAKPFAALALDWKADGSGTGLPVPGQAQGVFKAVNR